MTTTRTMTDEVNDRIATMPDGTRATWAEDGTCTFENVPGWDGYRISGRAAIVKGKPRMVAITIEPLRENVRPLTRTRLTDLPLPKLVKTAPSSLPITFDPELRTVMEALAPADAVKHDPRAYATLEGVAWTWLDAYSKGLAPRATVVKELGISSRTADRYIVRAREAGLLPPPTNKPLQGKVGEPQEETPRHERQSNE